MSALKNFDFALFPLDDGCILINEVSKLIRVKLFITIIVTNLIITNQVRKLRKVLEVQIESSSGFTAAEIKRVLNDDIRHHDEART